MVFLRGETELLQVVLAMGAIGRFARGLNRRHDQRDEHGDDGDDDEQLDERECRSRPENCSFGGHQDSLRHLAIGRRLGSATSVTHTDYTIRIILVIGLLAFLP